VLCTDGLWRGLTTSHLLEVAAHSPADACQFLCSDFPVGDEEASIVVIDFVETP
jgi:hypothetical protein